MKTDLMKAFILAAGKGTRLGELTQTCTKSMLPFGGKPLLDYIVTWLKSYNIRELIINIHHMPEQIMNYFGDGQKFGLTIVYSEEKNLLGTAGALDPMRDRLQERFLLIYGDLLTNVDLRAFTEWHAERDGSLSMTVYPVSDPTTAGIVEMDTDGRLTRFREKPRPNEIFSTLANAGVFVLEPNVLNFVPNDTYFDIGYDLIPALLMNGVRVYCYVIDDYLLDIGIPKRYEQAQLDFVAKRLFS